MTTDALRSISVLAVDDDRATLAALTMVLESHGADVHRANSASAAMAFCQTNGCPDVIVSDVSMTGTDGVALIAAIRAAERSAQRDPTPAVAVSGYTAPEDRKRALAAGFQVHIAKPINVTVLLNTIRDLVARRVSPTRARQRRAAK